MKVFLAVMLLFCFCKDKLEKVEYIGQIKDAKIIAGSLTTLTKIQVFTDQKVFVVRGCPVITIGDSAYFYYYKGYFTPCFSSKSMSQICLLDY